jgi:chemotaxis protein MotA
MKLILGAILIIGCILGGYVWEEGKILALVQPAELLIIGGSALGAFIISNSVHTLKKCLQGLGQLFTGSQYNRALYTETLSLLYAILQKVRKEGMMGIESDVDDPYRSPVFVRFPKVLAHKRIVDFIRDYFLIMTSGVMNVYEIENLIEVDMEASAHAARKPHQALTFLSDSLPAFGIVAAVMGVVVTMGAIGGPPEVLGYKVAAALVGTFLGILLSYGFLGPAAKYMESIAEDEEQYFTCIKTCIIAHLNGYPAKMAIEFARVSIAPDIRPSSTELEQLLQAAKY